MNNSAVYNEVKERMMTELRNRLGYLLPTAINDSIQKTFNAYNHVRLTDGATAEKFSLEQAVFISPESNGICWRNCKQLIDDLTSNTAQSNNIPNALETKVWNMTEQQVFKITVDESLPLTERQKILDTWQRKPSREKEYLERASDYNLPLDERLRLMREFNDTKDPAIQEAKDKERKEKLGNENLDTLDKILVYFDDEE